MGFRVLDSSGRLKTVGATGATGATGAGGALVLLEQHAALASASLDFTTAISATYDEYLIEIVGLVPATDNVDLRLLMSTDGGSSYDTGNNYARAAQVFNSAAAFFQGADSALANITLATNIDTTDAAGAFSMSIRLFNPGSTSKYKAVSYQGGYHNNDGKFYCSIGYGHYLVSGSAVNAFRLILSSGNISAGVARAYGVAKS